MLERGEADIVYNIPGQLINKVSKMPGVTLAPVLSGSFFLEFVNFQDPKSPFRDKRVREAISLAIDRRAMNQAETAGPIHASRGPYAGRSHHWRASPSATARSTGCSTGSSHAAWRWTGMYRRGWTTS